MNRTVAAVIIDIVRETYTYGAPKRFLLLVSDDEIARYSPRGENMASRDADLVREAFRAAGIASTIRKRDRLP